MSNELQKSATGVFYRFENKNRRQPVICELEDDGMMIIHTFTRSGLCNKETFKFSMYCKGKEFYNKINGKVEDLLIDVLNDLKDMD